MRIRPRLFGRRDWRSRACPSILLEKILHLAAEGEITCTQEEFLGDILIRLGEPG